MKLKAIYLLAIFILLAACSPQVTVTSEVTVTLPPPPTETPIPTPTVHPQFLEWQESIVALSERFALMPDGSIQDNSVPVPGVRVSPDGVMTLTLADGTVVTLDSSDVSFDDEKGFGVEGYELDSDLGTWEEVVAGYTLDKLATMSQADMIQAAPTREEIGLPEGVDIAKVAVGVEAGHVVTYNYQGEHVAVYDLHTGETHDQLGSKEYGNGQYLRVFWDNDWEHPDYTPELDTHKDLTDKMVRTVEAALATNLGSQENWFLYHSGTKLKVADKLERLQERMLPRFAQMAAEGMLFEGGRKIPLDGGVFIEGQLPAVYVRFEYSVENSAIINVLGKEGLPYVDGLAGQYPWVGQDYDKASNRLTITIGMDAKLAEMAQEELLAGPILGSLGDLVLDDLSSIGLDDARGVVLLHGLGVSSLGSDKLSVKYGGNLFPNDRVRPFFEGLDDKYYNR